MIIDAEQLPDGSSVEVRVLIAGGGLAGIALGRQLADAGLAVAILESGGTSPDPRQQMLYDGKMTVGDGQHTASFDQYLSASRVRCFGGSGNVWGGKCGPLDPIDFERRSWVPYSGWPITRAALQPYYDRACALLELPRWAVPPASPAAGPLFPSPTPLFSARTRAYTRYTGGLPNGPFNDYKNAALTHPRITVYLNANLTHVAMRQDGRRVESATIRTLTGRILTAKAETYVLATGGIENVRILLAANDVVSSGIGNHSDWLGRGFQGHSTIARDRTTMWAAGTADDMRAYDISRSDAPHTVLGVSDQAQTTRKQLNFTITLSGPTKDATPAAFAIQRAARHLSAAATPGMHADIYFMTEHAPNRDSRITLAPDDRDPLGMPRVRIDMRHSQQELDTLQQSTALLAKELGRLGAGRLQWAGTRADWIESMTSLSRHHMGATRMSSSPSDGVVNEYGRIHGVDNLHVIGSSIFPTSGLTNPTLTLLALGYRIGDRLIVANGRAA